jgi:glucose-6-phosphate isomerase
VVCDDALGISIDFSKSMMSSDVWGGLLNLAQEQSVGEWRDKMVAMEPINITENRAVGHMQLRSGTRADVQDVLDKMKSFVGKTHDDNAFTDVVHIGIGGSDLGPRFVCDALKHLPSKMNVHFVANVDGADIEEVLKPLDPRTTLFVIASKTFTTQETMMNAMFAKKWLGTRDIAKHMIALSTNEDAVAKFGINTDNMFPFWDWVGGRFSVWSAIGMPIALTYGFDIFQEFLNGAKVMDHHFMSQNFENNLPVLLALNGIWNRNFMDRSAVAVLPYSQNLALLPNFLQQVDMESNGKSVDRDGAFIMDYKTGPMVFGQAGTNGQHAFHQWLHQGSDIIPVEFLTIDKTSYDGEHHQVLNAHAQAQSQAFLDGEAHDDKHRHYNGNRPSVTISISDMSANSIGQLIALYEHKIFVQGMIWNINSFDQFGVELGKKLAKQILAR